jgi:hypothetical protein
MDRGVVAGREAGRAAVDPLGLPAIQFNTAFGLGDTGSVAPADLAGVALVAAKNLDARVTALDGGGSAGELQAQIDALAKKVKKANKKAKKAQKIAKKALKLAKAK